MFLTKPNIDGGKEVVEKMSRLACGMIKTISNVF